MSECFSSPFITGHRFIGSFASSLPTPSLVGRLNENFIVRSFPDQYSPSLSLSDRSNIIPDRSVLRATRCSKDYSMQADSECTETNDKIAEGKGEAVKVAAENLGVGRGRPCTSTKHTLEWEWLLVVREKILCSSRRLEHLWTYSFIYFIKLHLWIKKYSWEKKWN